MLDVEKPATFTITLTREQFVMLKNTYVIAYKNWYRDNTDMDFNDSLVARQVHDLLIPVAIQEQRTR